jgi:hypothetical protein
VRADPFSYALAPADASLWTVSSFDKVPDETVERFLSIAMQRNPSLGFRSCVIVNKRMYRLSQQAYFGTATFDREDLPYLAMLRRNHLQVRSVKYEADGLSFSFSHRSELAIVGLFDNLSCLEFLGALPSSLTVLDTTCSTPLTRPSSPTRLALLWDGEFSFEDSSFTFASAFPQLQELEIGGGCHSVAHLMSGQLQHLKLLYLDGTGTTVLPYDLIPWSSPLVLEVFLAEQQVQPFVDALTTAAEARVRSPSHSPLAHKSKLTSASPTAPALPTPPTLSFQPDFHRSFPTAQPSS